MKLALATPIVTMLPTTGPGWCADAGIVELTEIAVAADRLGYHHLTCSEHIGIPASEAPRRGARYWDPLPTFGYLAARTERILLATHVLVLGYHHPLEIVKRYGTLDVVSGGRLVLGVGVGSLETEFDLLDASFVDRGVRAEEALQALRASFGEREPVFHGEHYSYDGLVVEPSGLQSHVPIWIGGRTVRSLRRAVTFADGWCPFAVGPRDVEAWLARFDVPAGFEVSMMSPALDPIGEPDRAGETLERLASTGATIAAVALESQSVSHHVEQMEALVELHPVR